MELVLTYCFSVIAILLAICFALIKHPVHAALSFACVVLAAAGVYLLQDAAFVAASTVVVYAGATIIIFMFVLMFAQQTNLSDYDLHKQNPIAAGLVALGLAAVLIVAVMKEFPKIGARIAGKVTPAEKIESATGEEKGPEALALAPSVGDDASSEAAKTGEKIDTKDVAESSAETSAIPVVPKSSNTVAKLGAVLYTRYLLAVEIAGTLLLVATIGAVVIAQKEPNAAGAKGATK